MKKQILATALLSGALVFSSGLTADASYEAHIKEISVSKSTSGTGYYSHYLSFGSASTAGRGTLNQRFTFDLSTKKLTQVRLNNSYTKGQPYYTHMYAINSSGSTVRYSFSNKLFRDEPSTIWKPNITKPREVTVYFQDNFNTNASLQHRSHTFFKY
ncbi:hypothetical protein [Exiguobacterium aurantiacum]|uniref:Uncharacterized protein n=1 Tax=Exiguobacterium aurantiacum TaxID=33987 RepID=A0ABY5FK76_9BACL|nr:hypothetical protein [Exiguobacterium aurantiacum]UTT41968.1 hypothetical protein NMQ00_10385 [Exiguobacterium aurantiacum]